jgi:hypothetical protein
MVRLMLFFVCEHNIILYSPCMWYNKPQAFLVLLFFATAVHTVINDVSKVM